MAELDLARSVIAKEENDWVRSAEAVTALERKVGEEETQGRRGAISRRRPSAPAWPSAGACSRPSATPPSARARRAPSRSTRPCAPATTGCAARADREWSCPLVGGTCGACHTSVPLNRRSQIRSGAILDGCEGCGAILYPRRRRGVGVNGRDRRNLPW